MKYFHEIKLERDELISVLRYQYLSERYEAICKLAKNKDNVSSEQKLKWATEFIINTIEFKRLKEEIFIKYNIPSPRVIDFAFDPDSGLLYYNLRGDFNAKK